MSRITINYAPEIVVGWDKTFSTYFCQVLEKDGEAIIDVGDYDDRIISTAQLRRRAAEWSDYICPAVTHILRQHKSANVGNVELDITLELARYS